ncbi:alpha/beta hydrolase [Mycolicibacterium grossiae]|uniref:Lipase n=1 Tax=Mycolicibacterium grossiae TaxID=1552759 RepID=A0A1E8Q8D3_9MYCO|nr:alpha/beta hydrolase [Mycolicibacterium grossiae]OFJ54716.1 lipase [Mycolicibacterium grossiae]QEM46045.1 alpha/beta hydrolase [Mycolicibacterium grossiae]
MTTSLPAEPVRIADPGAGRPGPAKLALLNAVSGVLVPLVARIPEPVKRGLLGGRRVTLDGNTLDTTLQLVLGVQNASGVSGLVASDDVTVARAQLRALAKKIDPAIAVDVAELTVPGPAGDLGARHYAPPGSTGGEPLLVFFHGGGFVVGDLDTHDALCRLLCRDAGVHVLSVDYRLAPEHKAPAAGEDCYAAYRWAVAHAADLGADPARIAVGGDSAGGNLATVVCQTARAAGDVPLPALQLLIYPATNFAEDTRSKTLFAEGFFLTKPHMDWFRDNYLLGASVDVADPRISPLLADDLSGLPPAIVVTAGFDPLRDEGNRYADALAAAGVPVDRREYGSLVHGFANFFAMGGGSATATADVAAALRAHLSGS